MRYLIENGKTIIIPDAVSQELTRLTIGKNSDKVQKACQAQKIIREHEEIFQLEEADYSDEALYNAFADNEILVRLSHYKRDARQLLITNDRGLSRDAYRLNNQESVSGKRISVCRIDENGDLRMSKQPEREVERIIVKEPVYLQADPKVIEKTVYVQSDPVQKTNPGQLFLAVVAGGLVGYWVSKYRKLITRVLRIR